MSGIHFIADTHLSADTPALNMLLMQNMAEWLGKIDALYILGNFFEVWLGDDILHHVSEELVATLQAFSSRTPVYLQHGSRDFLLGADCAQRAGVTLLPAVATLQAYGQNVLLLHGDELYPHSADESNFRGLSRTAAWQTHISQTPVPERKQTLGQHILQHTHQPSAATPISVSLLMEVLASNASALQSKPTIVHAHNHYAFTGRFEHVWQGKTLQRWAMPAWQAERGGYLQLSDQGEWSWHDWPVSRTATAFR